MANISLQLWCNLTQLDTGSPCISKSAKDSSSAYRDLIERLGIYLFISMAAKIILLKEFSG